LIALSVFEHLTVNELHDVTNFTLNRKINILFTIPISEYEGGNYINPVFEKDKFHILRRPTLWWQTFFTRVGYDVQTKTDEACNLFHGKKGMALLFCTLANTK